jgi:hypothetical protein
MNKVCLTVVLSAVALGCGPAGEGDESGQQEPLAVGESQQALNLVFSSQTPNSMVQGGDRIFYTSSEFSGGFYSNYVAYTFSDAPTGGAIVSSSSATHHFTDLSVYMPTKTTGNVYFIDSQFGGPSAIKKVPIDGGATTTLYTAPSGTIISLVADNAHVYFTDATAVRRIPVAGAATAEHLYTVAAANDVLIADNRLYMRTGTEVHSCDKSGANVEDDHVVSTVAITALHVHKPTSAAGTITWGDDSSGVKSTSTTPGGSVSPWYSGTAARRTTSVFYNGTKFYFSICNDDLTDCIVRRTYPTATLAPEPGELAPTTVRSVIAEATGAPDTPEMFYGSEEGLMGHYIDL